MIQSVEEKMQKIHALKKEIGNYKGKLGIWEVYIMELVADRPNSYGHYEKDCVFYIYAVDYAGDFHNVSSTEDEVLALQRLLMLVRAQSNLQRMHDNIARNVHHI